MEWTKDKPIIDGSVYMYCNAERSIDFVEVNIDKFSNQVCFFGIEIETDIKFLNGWWYGPINNCHPPLPDDF